MNTLRRLVAVSQFCDSRGIPWHSFPESGSLCIRGKERPKCAQGHHTYGNTRLNLKPEILPALDNVCMSVSTRKSYESDDYHAGAETEEGADTQFLTQLHPDSPENECWNTNDCTQPRSISFVSYNGVDVHELNISVRISSAMANPIRRDSLWEPKPVRHCTWSSQ